MKKVREKLNAKLRKSGGFTLVEMLIVVAIIAILIAISIPLISTTLEKARVGVDEANERSAMSMAEAYFLTTYDKENENPLVLYYIIDAKTHQGRVVKVSATGTGDDIVNTAPTKGATGFDYGLSSGDRTNTSNGATGSPEGSGITVTIDKDGKITELKWVE